MADRGEETIREHYKLRGYRLAEKNAECFCGQSYSVGFMGPADYGEWFSSANVYRVVKDLEAEIAGLRVQLADQERLIAQLSSRRRLALLFPEAGR